MNTNQTPTVNQNQTATEKYDPFTYMMPSREFVLGLKEGNEAPDCFGRWAPVTKIFGRGLDINGQAYVCYYTKHGENGSMSHQMRESELIRTVALTGKHTSAELDSIEEELRAGIREATGRTVKAEAVTSGSNKNVLNVVVTFGANVPLNQNSRIELTPDDARALRNELTRVLGAR